MNAHPDSGRSRADGDPVERLVRLAGPHEPIPPERLARVKDAARVAWQAQVHARRRRTRIVWVTAALGTAALALLTILPNSARKPAPAPAVEVGTVQHLRGAVARRSADDTRGDEALRSDDRLYPGDSVTTSNDGLLAVRLSTGVALRLDRGTRLRVVSATALTLDAGAIYVVSDAASAGRRSTRDDRGAPAVEIRTAFGVARDIGTRFEARVDQEALRVRVRDGLVSVDGAPPVPAGMQVTLARDGRVLQERVNTFGPEWTWTVALASPFTLEGRSLREFLDWVSTETGLQIRFARGSDEQKATTLTLHGSIEGLSPEQALDAVLPASGVDHAVADGVVTIRGIAEAVGR